LTKHPTKRWLDIVVTVSQRETKDATNTIAKARNILLPDNRNLLQARLEDLTKTRLSTLPIVTLVVTENQIVAI